MTASAAEKLQDMVKAGLVSDIFKMERAFHLHREIGLNADVLNSRAVGNFGEVFGTIQQTMETEAALAVARLYDTPTKYYPTRCLRNALKLLEERGRELPEIVETDNTKLALKFLEDREGLVESVDLGRDVFLPKFIPAFRAILDSPDVKESIENLKYLRDKHIAHNEAAQPGGPTWEALADLIAHAQRFVGVIGWAFFSTVYMHDGQYFLSDDAQRPSRALKRLVQRISKNDT